MITHHRLRYREPVAIIHTFLRYITPWMRYHIFVTLSHVGLRYGTFRRYRDTPAISQPPAISRLVCDIATACDIADRPAITRFCDIAGRLRYRKFSRYRSGLAISQRPEDRNIIYVTFAPTYVDGGDMCCVSESTHVARPIFVDCCRFMSMATDVAAEVNATILPS